MHQTAKTTHVFLHPGEMVVGTAECRIHTLLGSCVSIILWHPVRKIGAMSHAVVPTRSESGRLPLEARYSDEVTAMMLRELETRNVDPRECWAGVYGGGSMFSSILGQIEMPNIGERNAEIAISQLAGHGIVVNDRSLLGTGYRRIDFNVATGEVLSRRVEGDVSTYYAGAEKGYPNPAKANEISGR